MNEPTNGNAGVAPAEAPRKPVKLVEGPPREIGQGLDRYGEHMDRPGTAGVGRPDGESSCPTHADDDSTREKEGER